MPIPGLKTRPPTGRVPYPCILIEGEEKAGKSWEMIRLTGSDKISESFILDLAEGSTDEYGAIPGARFEMIEHDGSYAAILDAIQKAHAYGRQVLDAGGKPIMFGLDSSTLVWDGLKDWTSTRAAKSDKNKRLLAADPNAELLISQNLWNDAGARWRKLQTLLITFPGIVIITARGKEVVEVKDGRPVEGSRIWSVQSHKELPFAATVWLRMHRNEDPEVIGARSVRAGIRPGRDRVHRVTEKAADERLLEWLIWDVLGVTDDAPAREVQNFTAGELLPEERAEEQQAAASSNKPTAAQLASAVREATTEDALRSVWGTANRHGMLRNAYNRKPIEQLINERLAELQKPAETDPDAATPDPEESRRDTGQRQAVLATMSELGMDDQFCEDRWYLTIEQSATTRLLAAVEQELQLRKEQVGA